MTAKKRMATVAVIVFGAASAHWAPHRDRRVASAGGYYQLNDQISIGSHTGRTAFFVSANGNRSGLGLETLSPEILHDRRGR